MTIHFCDPDIAAHPTGGNRYNESIRDVWPPSDTLTTGIAWSETPNDADVWVVDSLLVDDDGLLDAWAQGPPAVLMVHYLHLVDPSQMTSDQANKEAERLSLFSGYVAPSHFVSTQLASQGIAPDRIVVAPPGLSRIYRQGTPSQGPALRSATHLLSVANRLPNKQLIPCLHMLEELYDLPWTWTVIGDETLDPEHATAFREAVAQSAVADRVQVHGAQSAEAVRAAYKSADILLCPSRFETSSMVAREALAAGVPVLGFRGGGLPETLGETAGLGLVPAGDIAALRTRLHTVLTTPHLYNQMRWRAVRASRGVPCWTETALRIRLFVQQLVTA